MSEPGSQGGGMLVAKDLLPFGEYLTAQLFCLLPSTLVPDHPREIVPGRQGLRMLAAQDLLLVSEGARAEFLGFAVPAEQASYACEEALAGKGLRMVLA